MTYYIRIRSLFRSFPPLFAGPFASRDDAEAEIIRACVENVSRDQAMRNLRNVPYTYDILTQTTARRIGLRDWIFGDSISNLTRHIMI